MFSLVKPAVLGLVVVGFFAMAAPSQAAVRDRMVPATQTVDAGEVATGQILTHRRCAKPNMGRALERWQKTRRGYRWGIRWGTVGLTAGERIALTVRCGSKTLRGSVTVRALEIPETPEEPQPGPPKPTAPRLTGSDAEAEAWWQSTRPRFTDLSHGWCSDYAYYKRPDIPERIEKWAYKQWVADGTPYIDIRDGQRKSMNDRAEPTPDRFGIAREQGVDMPEYPYLGSYAARPDAPVSFLVAAKRAGFTVDRTPHPGDWEVTPGHMAYVESVSADGLHYQVTEMGASNPGIVFHRTERADWGNINNKDAYFVG